MMIKFQPELPRQVAIIGAGFAGLSAAAVLERNNIDYVVYEGANRVGGRVYSVPYGMLALLNFADWDDGGSEPRSFTLKKKGFRDILEDIKVKVPENRIKLNSVVTKITYSENRVTLCLSNGEEYHYDYVIVTCPLGFLKRNYSSFFSPPLETRKADAILSLGFGNMMKVFLEYTRPWWPQDANAIAPLDSHSPLAESFPMLQPLYWNKKILVAWVSGKGPQLISKLSDEELVEGLTHHLREALGDPLIPLPVKIFRHSWITDPLVGGSYSYLTPDSVKYVPDAFVRMAEPIIIEDKYVISSHTIILFS
ncbi:amine oxidase [Teladorsagia circumcincta]|uniref:Amine oxidase n=1 Tax=Teladorsagia circumcincta TaxID=45464 RepID=A0A2G9TSY1_TELCI|nr:amine oxidase [Teladorsagia circumcincta]